MNEKRILLMLHNRDELALKAIIAEYGVLCRSVALDILKDEQDVEECVSDTLLTVWNAIPPANPDNFRAYLLKILRNQALNRYKAKQRGKRGNGQYTVVLDELAEVLPDDMIDSANQTRFRRRGSFWYLFPTVAACLMIGITAILYPKLRAQKPAVVTPHETGTTVTEDSLYTTDNELVSVSSTFAQISDTQKTERTATTAATASGGSTQSTVDSSVTQRTTTDFRSTDTKQTTAHTSTQDTQSTVPSITSVSTTVVEDETTPSSWQGQNVPFSILSERIVGASEEAWPYAAQSRLYRSNLPEEFAAHLFPAVDFEAEDCLVIRFRTTGCGDGKAVKIGGTGMFYGFSIVPAAMPKDTVKEFIIAAVIPKSLYSSASPDGINRWRCSDAPMPATDRMQCMLLRYDE